MKVQLFLTFLLGAGVLAKHVPLEIFDIWNEIIGPYDTECALEAKISQEYVRESILAATVPSEERLKVYMVCIYERLGFFQPDGNFNKDKIQSVPYMAKSITEECIAASTKGKDRLERSYLAGSCIVNRFAIDQKSVTH